MPTPSNDQVVDPTTGLLTDDTQDVVEVPLLPHLRAFNHAMGKLVEGLRAKASDFALAPSVPGPGPLSTKLRSWHEDYLHRSTVPDLTGTAWPALCDAHTVFRGGSSTRGVTCTRRRGHTGRHAAGRGGRVVAVWEVSA